MINEIMEGLPGKFRPEMAGNLSTTIQFNFSETEQPFWVLTIGDGRCTIIEGMVEQAAATVSMSAADFIGINTGEIPAPDVFWSGQIKIDGDVEAVISLAPILGWQ